MQTQRVIKIIWWLIIGEALIYLLSISSFGCSPPAASIGGTKKAERVDSLAIKNLEIYQKRINDEYESGLQAYNNNQFYEAITHFQQVIQLDSINYQKNVWSQTVEAYKKLELADSALFYCRKGLEKYPQKLELLVQAGGLHEQLGQNDEAIQIYQKLVKLTPHTAAHWKKLANLNEQKDIENAIFAYSIIATIAPEDTASMNKQAALLQQTRDPIPVLDRLIRTKRQNPGQSKPVFDLGQFYFIKKDYPKAETEFREYLKLEPNDEIGREYLAASFQNQNKFDAAINVYLTILQTDTLHIKSLCEIAYCLKKLEKFDKARDYVMQARKIDSGYGLSYLILGEIYQQVAENCQKERERLLPDWEDRLIYQMAYDQYNIASQDTLFKSIAESKLQTVKRFIPTKEDWFMHPNDTQAKLKCYEWIYQ